VTNGIPNVVYLYEDLFYLRITLSLNFFHIADNIQAPDPVQYIDVDDFPPRALPMRALNLFSSLRPMTPIAEPRSGTGH
jgi:hypothetical protein